MVANRWGRSSWKRLLLLHMVAHGLYLLYPNLPGRASFSTNHVEPETRTCTPCMYTHGHPSRAWHVHCMYAHRSSPARTSPPTRPSSRASARATAWDTEPVTRRAHGSRRAPRAQGTRGTSLPCVRVMAAGGARHAAALRELAHGVRLLSGKRRRAAAADDGAAAAALPGAV